MSGGPDVYWTGDVREDVESEGRSQGRGINQGQDS